MRIAGGLLAAVLVLLSCSQSGSKTPRGGHCDDLAADLAAGLLDPAPGTDQPGVHGCAGCPETTLGATTIDAGAATTRDFGGTVANAACDGVFYLRGPGGREIGGAIRTDPVDGGYAFTLPLFCGSQLLKLGWANASGRTVAVVAIDTGACTEPQLRITLGWDGLGEDWELHLIRPGGRINDQVDGSDCTWTTCIDTSPDWGAPGLEGDPVKDVDNTEAFGPENIVLPTLEAGAYTVMVEHWGSGDPASSGQVILNVKGTRTTLPISHLAPQHVRTVATIDGTSGAVTSLDQDFDCTASWDDGCIASLP